MKVDRKRPVPPTSPEPKSGPYVVRKANLGPLGVGYDVIAPNGKVRTCHGGGHDDGKQAADRHAGDLNAAWRELGGPELLKALRDVEWSGNERDEDGVEVSCCPWCGEPEINGHNEGCGLSAALRQATGGVA